jgi:DNA helicase-2/ATP-dependent DNA helicase PcrA
MLNDRANEPAKTLFDTGIHPGLKKMNGVLESLIGDVPNVTLQQLFENVIQNGAVLTYIMKHPEKISLMQMLTAFFDFIKDETKSKNKPTRFVSIASLESLYSKKIIHNIQTFLLPISKEDSRDKLTEYGLID